MAICYLRLSTLLILLISPTFDARNKQTWWRSHVSRNNDKENAQNPAENLESRVQELLLKVILPVITLVILFFILHCIIGPWNSKIIQCIILGTTRNCPLESVIHETGGEMPSQDNAKVSINL